MTAAALSISPIDLVLRVSAKSIGASEIPANTNSGPYVERVLKRVGLAKGNPWCAADVADTGAIALELAWPLPLTAGCVVLGEFAEKHAILFDTPERGDVFLLWELVKGEWRFAHTGFVTQVISGRTCRTHEGNTSGGGSREGWLKAERSRTFGEKDRFARWVNLL